MERVIIIGCGGSGKSTLARILGERTGLPVVHLDQICWSPGNWQHLEPEEFDARLTQELEKPRWILDGNFNRTLPLRLAHCDTVIWLDYNRFVCIFSWLKRVITNWGKTRPDMGPNCNEKLDLEFAKWIWTFNKKNRCKYHEILAQQKDKEIHIFKNRRQLRKFLNRI
jgi:adenylate kinase family enzyme